MGEEMGEIKKCVLCFSKKWGEIEERGGEREKKTDKQLKEKRKKQRKLQLQLHLSYLSLSLSLTHTHTHTHTHISSLPLHRISPRFFTPLQSNITITNIINLYIKMSIKWQDALSP